MDDLDARYYIVLPDIAQFRGLWEHLSLLWTLPPTAYSRACGATCCAQERMP